MPVKTGHQFPRMDKDGVFYLLELCPDCKSGLVVHYDDDVWMVECSVCNYIDDDVYVNEEDLLNNYNVSKLCYTK